MKNRRNLGIVFSALIILFLGYLILQPRVRQNLRFFWSMEYSYLIYGMLIFGILAVFFKDKVSKYLKYPFYLIFLPLLIFPLIRCYFSIPYVFCRVCPRQCPWGVMRPFVIPAVVVMNLDKRFWCFRLCPFGTIQDQQSKECKKRIKLPRWLLWIRYLFLVITILITFAAIADIAILDEPVIFNGNYDYVLLTMIAASVIFVLSFCIHRFWCNYFCPVGTVGDIGLKILKK